MSDDVIEGDVIGGRYRIARRIGSGAGGRIYLAYDLRLGKRETAIKFYEPDALIQDLSEHVRSGIISRDVYDNEVSNIYHRFRQEAIGISRLDHPAIVKVYAYQDAEYMVSGQRGDRMRSQPFLCMEYVEGMTLEEALAADRIGLEMGLLIGSQVADGLEFAHRVGFVHRDLKPSNIMIEGQGEDVQAKIIDWGVAKVVADEAKAAANRLSSDPQGEDIRTRGLLLGTPKFIAPEHFESGGAKWTSASDIFSLGMILFRLLTKRPLRRESYVGECLTGSDRNLLQEACQGQTELTEVVLSCLSEMREERMSAREVRDNLRRIYDRRQSGGKSEVPFAITSEEQQWHPSAPNSVDREVKTVVHEVSSDEAPASSVVMALNQNKFPVLLGALAMLGVLGIVYFILRGGNEEALDENSETAAVESPAPVVESGAAPTVPEPAVAPEEERFSLEIEIRSEPEAIVFLKTNGKGGEGKMLELGTTPLPFVFEHPHEAQRVVFRVADEKKRRIYPDMEQLILASQFGEAADDSAEIPVFKAKMRSADIFDPENDYNKKFDQAILEDK